MSSGKKPKPRRAPPPLPEREVKTIDWSWTFVPAAWIVLFCAAYATYVNSFNGRLFFDDLSSVIGNPYVQVFVNPYFSQPDRKWTADGLIRAFDAEIDTPFAGRPIVSLTFALTHWWAFDAHPAHIPEFYGVLPPHFWYYHIVNFSFHVAVGILLFQLLRRTFRSPNVREYTGRNANLWALAASLIWIVHPINTETVVYVTQRTEQVVSLFLLLTIFCGSLSITVRSRELSLLLKFLAFVFCHWGMDSKENMVAAPLLMVLYDRAFYYETWRETLRQRWGFYLALFLTYVTLAGRNNAVLHLGPKEADTAGTLDYVSFVVKEFGRTVALFIPLMILDRIAYQRTWGETLRNRLPYYGLAFAALFGTALIVGFSLDSGALASRHDSAMEKLNVEGGGFSGFFWFAFYAVFGLDFITTGIVAIPLLLLAALMVVPDRLLNYGSFKDALVDRWPYYLTIVGLFLMLHTGAEVGPRGMSVGFGFERMNSMEYLITQCWCLLRYLRVTLIPTGLCVDYGRLPILDLLHVVPGAAVVLSLLALTVWGWFRRPWVGFLGCWFFFILAPTSSFIPIVTEVGAERRMYLPVAAVIVGIGAALAALVTKLTQAPLKRPSTEMLLVCLCGLVTLMFGWVIYYYLIAEYGEEENQAWKYYVLFPLTLCAGSCLLVLLRGGLAEGARSVVSTSGRPGLLGLTAICGGVQIVALVFSLISFNRNTEYLTDTTLYGHIPRVFPWNERGCNNYAKICIDEGRIEEAEQLLNDALRIDPEYSDAFTNRGIIFHRRKEMDRAIQNASEAIRWNPLNPSAWNNRGNAFIELKLFEKAVADFSQLVKMNERGVEGYYGRANTYYLWGKLPEALADIDSVIKLSPGDYKAYNTRGNILKQMGKHMEAVQAFNNGVSLLIAEARSAQHPALPAVEQCLRGDLSNHQVALQFGNRPTLATIFGNRADAYRNLHEAEPQGNAKQLMIDDLNRAIWMHPENLVYRLALGQQLFNLKMYPQALNIFTQVLQLQNNNLDAIRGKILTLYEMKNWDMLWRIAKFLRDNGAPIDEPTLNKWREESGRGYPPDSEPGVPPWAPMTPTGVAPGGVAPAGQTPTVTPPAGGVPVSPPTGQAPPPGGVPQVGTMPLSSPVGTSPAQPSGARPAGPTGPAPLLPGQQGPSLQGPLPQGPPKP